MKKLKVVVDYGIELGVVLSFSVMITGLILMSVYGVYQLAVSL